jgi:hypothetical protein
MKTPLTSSAAVVKHASFWGVLDEKVSHPVGYRMADSFKVGRTKKVRVRIVSMSENIRKQCGN